MSENQLKGYFSFDDTDLIANKAGKLSPKQNKKLTANDEFTQRLLTGFVLVCSTSAFFFMYRAFVNPTSAGAWVGAGIAAFFATFFARGLFNKIDYSVQRVQGEVQFVKVEKLSGSPADPIHKRKKEISYAMQVGSESFSNANPALTEYMQGNIYAVYYTKDTRKILSVELISKAK